VVKDNFANYNSKREQVKFSICDFIFIILCPCIKRSESVKRTSWKKISNRTKEDCDIFIMLKRMKEIEQLRDIILTPAQLHLFNYLKKQPLTISSTEESTSRQIDPKEPSVFFHLGDGVATPTKEAMLVKELFDSFSEIKYDTENFISRNLLTKIDPDLQETLNGLLEYKLASANETLILSPKHMDDKFLSTLRTESIVQEKTVVEMINLGIPEENPGLDISTHAEDMELFDDPVETRLNPRLATMDETNTIMNCTSKLNFQEFSSASELQQQTFFGKRQNSLRKGNTDLGLTGLKCPTHGKSRFGILGLAKQILPK
jgi:hypothetical protein